MKAGLLFLEGLRYRKSHELGDKACFVCAGVVVAGFLAYSAAVGAMLGPMRFLDGTAGVFVGLSLGSLSLAAIAWLTTADTARRGLLLRDRDLRIAELETQLAEARRTRP
jgi:hypothetical protein